MKIHSLVLYSSEKMNQPKYLTQKEMDLSVKYIHNVDLTQTI